MINLGKVDWVSGILKTKFKIGDEVKPFRNLLILCKKCDAIRSGHKLSLNES